MRQIFLAMLIPELAICLMGCGSSRAELWKTVHVDKSLDDDRSSVLSMRFDSSTHGWAITANSLLETLDGGKTWTKQIQGDDDRVSFFESLVTIDSVHMWIVGSEKCTSESVTCGLVLATSDGGKHWNRFEVPGVKAIHSAQFCSVDEGWAVSDRILHTLDGGKTWTEMAQPLSSDSVFYGVDCFGCKDVIVAGTNGVIMLTRDGGSNWIRGDSGTAATILRVHYFGEQAWAVGGSGTVLSSSNHGVKWKPAATGTAKALTDILIRENRGWIVGQGGTALFSVDRGESWKTDNSGISYDLYSLSFADTSVWAGGQTLSVLRLDLSR